MRVIALFGRGNIGKTRCLGHLINLIHSVGKGCNYLFEGQDARVTLDYKGHRITICTWGDNEYEEQLNIEKILNDQPEIAIVATRTKGETVRMVERFCTKMNYPLKWVEKYVTSFDDKSGQEYMNKLQAEQILDYIQGLIEGQLYYVDSITSIDTEGENGRYHVSLLGADMSEEGFPRTLSLELNGNELYFQELGGRVQEDDFVLYRPDSELRFFNGNETQLATVLRNESRDMRLELLTRQIAGEGVYSIRQKMPNLVKSYHVNVGHGNCSLILSVYGTEYDLWMVDCSSYDYLKRRDYSQNLYHCLADIANLLNVDLSSLRISRFMLTHTHFDHYNGLRYLVKHGLVDDKTLVYANLYYDCASPVWNGILKELLKLQCKFVEPVSENGNAGAIRIFHPECRLFKKANQVQGNERAVNEVNNSSVVYGIKLNEHIMVFPGDLEQKGFENMSRAGKCSSLLFRADYYVVSHHGSINGHPALACASPSQPIPTVLECATNGLNKAILMGRNGAYSGIYSPVVENYWNTACGLEYTEKAKHYVELEWNSGAVTTK